ncbi:glucose-1-phosphate cytidylyltransferase [Geobacter sp. DSM 9736]|uniref:glucose-1-phosphate cytidylyltransferase n=1 Tax=Geobacter sp. DSM 9736 TaxID=1277350 RepID=UPI000B509D0B|nr:glucose-1-phosphate cytidylyltransferase [Geobacter sp. DSM 9736]SNB45026.1 glucose-1-phosphate cytidylyltransferase [Geobacter sp. DSM 9736]
MKVVILAGGLGTRLSEETVLRPKPMVEIGGKPILWHIMKIYSYYGFNEFIVCLGFKGYVIKEYFSNYFLHMSDVTFDMANNSMTVHERYAEPWKVTLVDTGMDSMTGGRVKRIEPYINNETFMLTYGDGVADVDIPALLAFHKRQGRLATVTTTQPAGRFGALSLTSDNRVASFHEKPAGDGAWINGGFFVLEPGVMELIAGDSTVFEKEPLERLAAEGELAAFRHSGFWQPMDTLRDKTHLEDLWNSGTAPWKVWGQRAENDAKGENNAG